MMEYNFQLVIVPEDYDYGEEEIAYRIYFDDQLISERSLPILKPNQGIVDTFFISIEENNIIKKLRFINLKSKKAIFKKIIINNVDFCNNNDIRFQGLNLKIDNL